MNFRAIIVDDERLARSELRHLLREHESVEVVGEAASAGDALGLIDETRPDVVFLDIEMPGCTGFEMLEEIDVPVRVVFVTAYDRYAIRAFEVNAVDYLLKPVSPVRLAATLERIRAGAPARSPDGRLRDEDQVLIKMSGRLFFVRVAEMAYIRAAGDYSEIFSSSGRRGLVDGTLKKWQERLPPESFIRIHRSTIVNLRLVEYIERQKNATCLVFVRAHETPLVMSRRYAARFGERKL